MGLGMQKWIYTQRPRRPFSKRKRAVGDTIEHHSIDELNIAGRTHQNIVYTEKEKQEVLQRIRRRSLNDKVISAILVISIISITVIVLINLRPWESTGITEQRILEEQREELTRKNEIFNLSMNYGDSYFKRGDFESAIEEYYHALEIFPLPARLNERNSRT